MFDIIITKNRGYPMKYRSKNQPKPLAIAVATAIAMGCAGSSVTFAQEIEELVIQAELRDTTESTTAISMEVMTAEDLASNQVKDLEDLQKSIPNVQFNTNGAGWAQANIRGVGNPSNGGPNEQVGVPILIDRASQGEEIGLGGGFMFDVGNVQVLRGPQGTFIGQSATGGAILVNSARPNFDGVNGFMDAQIADYGQRKLTGAINLPMSDTIAGRLSFLSETRESFYTNVAGGEQSIGEDYAPGSAINQNFRLGLQWEPNEQFQAYLKLESTRYENEGSESTPNLLPRTGFYDDDGDPLTPAQIVTTYSRNAPGPAPGTGTPFDRDGDGVFESIFGGTPGPGGVQYAPTEPFQLAHPANETRIQENGRYLLDMTYEFDNGIALNSLTSQIQLHNVGIAGYGNSRAYGNGGVSVNLGPKVETKSQEFTLISPEGQTLEWIVGITASQRSTDVSIAINNNAGPGNGATGWQADGSWSPRPLTDTVASRTFVDVSAKVKQQAVFGQLDWNVSDELQFTLGGRINKDHNTGKTGVSFTSTTPSPDHSLCAGANGAGLYCLTDGRNISSAGPGIPYIDTTPTYKVGVNWEPSDNQFFYAFYARGYKAGQLVNPGAEPVNEELVDDYEMGWKGTLLDGALYAEFGVFFMDYTDMQMSVLSATAIDTIGGFQNIGDSEIKGFESSIRTNLGGLNLNASLGYTKSELGDVTVLNTAALNFDSGEGRGIGDSSKGCVVSPGQICNDYSPYSVTLSGASNLNSPELSYNISIDYPIELGNGTLTPELAYSYADESYNNLLQFPGDSYYIRDERKILNFNLSYDIDDWSLQGFVTNVTDELYNEQAGDSYIYGDPRTIGFRARMNF
jgi:iron complex outermembrane recepter protein